MPTVGDCCDFLERLAPLNLAAEWDNVGLLLGDRRAEVRRVLTCLTITPEVAAEAVTNSCQLIVSHHPIFFKGIQKLTSNTPENQAVLTLARAGIAVYSAHTAYDDCPNGINTQLARLLGLRDVQPLRGIESRRAKIVVFVPDSDLTKVLDALFAAGAGLIGQYRECSYRLAGTGTFFATEATNPTLGQKGRREEVPEWRVEVVCDETQIASAIRSMRSAHSYEEPAYDVYPLRPMMTGQGRGRVGLLESAMPLDDFARRVKERLSTSVQVVGKPTDSVRKVALACGAAGEFIRDASRHQADVFLTGEFRYHDALTAASQGPAVIVAGHHATERHGVEELARQLRGIPGVEVSASTSETNPLRTL